MHSFATLTSGQLEPNKLNQATYAGDSGNTAAAAKVPRAFRRKWLMARMTVSLDLLLVDGETDGQVEDRDKDESEGEGGGDEADHEDDSEPSFESGRSGIWSSVRAVRRLYSDFMLSNLR
ncbi:hypothetical protein E4U15_003262 [Claviceps sp. LM218 group G6]|nr:hypothetical protein E4U15_003262 [Claviceps sp. LM218 group G6]KAG6110121.1 hypothetical protein E4U14_002918 [Claviceps sp. LM454 group G7]